MLTREEARRFIWQRAGLPREISQSVRDTWKSRCSATAQGHAVWLGSRDCSLQRRHQKVLEEAPAPGIDPALDRASRRALRDRRVNRSVMSVSELSNSSTRTMPVLFHRNEYPPAGRASGDRDDQRHRHRAAADFESPRARGACSLIKAAVSCVGHALECRINAEDPKDVRCRLRARFGSGTCQGDSACAWIVMLYAGYRISPYYDSLIGKLDRAWGQSRGRARQNADRAVGDAHCRHFQQPASASGLSQ
jgi:acetyl-CoA carboxylase biotin carboxylase subunit